MFSSNNLYYVADGVSGLYHFVLQGGIPVSGDHLSELQSNTKENWQAHELDAIKVLGNIMGSRGLRTTCDWEVSQITSHFSYRLVEWSDWKTITRVKEDIYLRQKAAVTVVFVINNIGVAIITLNGYRIRIRGGSGKSNYRFSWRSTDALIWTKRSPTGSYYEPVLISVALEPSLAISNRKPESFPIP